jgi:isopenicillin N synthase-like dioxygenase
LYEIGLDWSKVSEKERQYPLQEETPWPDCEGSQDFIKFMTSHYERMLSLGIQLMSQIAEGLGKPKDFFD